VHQSNFRVVGFTESPELADLARSLRTEGSSSSTTSARASCRTSATSHGRESLAAGAHVVTFSGDKLFGGPQAGSSSAAPTSSSGCAATRCSALSAPTS
jgi:L-seryl-tRNA(Ser) seleniumtransferase